MTKLVETELQPLPFQSSMLDYLQEEESRLWDWFSSGQVMEKATEEAQLELLKNCYRMARESQKKGYAALDTAAENLGIKAPMTLYQAEGDSGPSACLISIPNEVHIVLFGHITELLTAEELTALFGHELAHYHLLNSNGGAYRIAHDLLHALCNDPQAGPEHANSQRLMQLFGEVYADRGGLLACGDLDTAIAMGIKVCTGLKEVSAESYLRQADEIFDKSNPTTEGITHPESYIRARALKLWSEQGEDCEMAVSQMIRGPLSINGLDLISQCVVQRLTRQLIDRILAPHWLQTELTLAHARLYFEEYEPAPPPESEELKDLLKTAAPDFVDYIGFVLMDLVAADPELEEAPAAHAILLAEELGIAKPFRKLAAREMKLTQKRYDLLAKQAQQICEKAEKAT